MTTLRDKQIAELERMLQPGQNDELPWKVLVMDAKARAIVSLVLRVNDLLKLGVTLHALLLAQRSAMPDVPAVYFCEPTSDNLVQILHDLEHDKYELAYINFTLRLPRSLLEEFATKVSVSGKAAKIKSMWDRYVDFVVTEPNLFSLDMKEMFYKFGAMREKSEIEPVTEHIAAEILGLVHTSGAVPIIRAPQGGPAELVAAQLNMTLREYLRLSPVATPTDVVRPVLVLLDRQMDLALMFSHLWIYQVMVADVFSLKRNTIKLKEKSYDVDPKDFFWTRYSQLPFPDVVEHADAELNTYKRDAQELTNKTGITSLDDIDNLTLSTTAIQQAVDALPELTARKATLDMHMDILLSLIGELQANLLDKFFEIEQHARDPKTVTEFSELLAQEPTPPALNVEDKYRTFLIMVLMLPSLPSDFVDRATSWFKEHGVDLGAYHYIANLKLIAQMLLASQLSTSYLAGTAEQLLALLLLSLKLYGLTEGRISEGLTLIALKVKLFIPEKQELPVTKVVQALMDPQNAAQDLLAVTDNYVYYDPKAPGSGAKEPLRLSFTQLMVFMVGGANYYEYQNLQEWAEKAKKVVAYGGTDVVSPAEFLGECNKLGNMQN